MNSLVSVFHYSDYRELLRDWFWTAKKNNPKISFRFVAKHLGLSSPNHFHLVISQKRHISETLVAKVTNLLKLDVRERQYFKLLFHHNIAKDDKERNDLHEKIEQLRKQLVRDDIQDDKLQVVAHNLAWYIKMGSMFFSGKTPSDMRHVIKSSCTFPVNEAEIDQALAILEETKLLRFENGLSVFDYGYITTKWDLDRYEIKQHHISNLKLAMESVGWPIDRRFLSSVTIPCSDEFVQSVIADIRSLCLSILQRANDQVQETNDASKVMTLHFSLFPYFDLAKQST